MGKVYDYIQSLLLPKFVHGFLDMGCQYRPPPTSPLLLVVLLLFDQLFDILVLLIHIKFLSYQLQGMV